MADDRLRKFAWFVLIYNLAVVMFGTVVRATGSGAGCGSDWPACRGGVVPLSGTVETVVEFSHRVSSALALVLVFTLLVWVLRQRPRGDAARASAIAAGVLVITEALVGALLVFFGWVEDDQSMGRAVSIAVHLCITFLLLGALSLTAWWLGDGSRPHRPLPRRERRLVGWTAAGLILAGATGAITALGDTLFPAESIFQGVRDDFTGAFLVRLRWVHPIVAVVVALALARIASRYAVGGTKAGRLSGLLIGIVVAQIVLGVVNVLLLAPIWMQLVHLVAADVLWVVFVLFSVEAMAVAQRTPESVPV